VAHVIIIYDEDGIQIGEYYPPHDGSEGGRSFAGRVEIRSNAFMAAVQKAVGDKDAMSVEVKFKAKK
jgi:hypothetical protein